MYDCFMESSEKSLQSFMDRVRPLRSQTARLSTFEPEMRVLFSRGYTLVQIHQYLVEEREIKVSLRAFRAWLQKNDVKLGRTDDNPR